MHANQISTLIVFSCITAHTKSTEIDVRFI
jgi:hypothetical protein